MVELDLLAMLRALDARGVESIMGGVLAACLQGAPLVALDLAVVARKTEENAARLRAALRDLGSPTPDAALGDEPQVFETRSGVLRVAGAVDDRREYDELRPAAIELEVADGLRVAVLPLDTLVALARAGRSAEERAMLPMLERTLDELRRASA